MDRKPWIGIVICMLLIVNVSVVLGNTDNIPQKTSTKMEPNLAPNPSFEEGDTLPTGWTFPPNTTGIYNWDTNYAYSGEKSVGVLNLTNFPEEFYWITTDFIPVDYATYSYYFSVWYKFIGVPSEAQYATLRIWEYDENYQLVHGIGTGSGSTSEWQLMSIETQYTQKVKYVKLELGHEAWILEPNPLAEVRFDDVYLAVLNTAPNTPTITGETNGKVRTLYDYTITTIDPNQDNVTYEIDWGDNTTQTTEYYKSGEEITISHIWGIERTYTVQVRAIDENNAKSSWAILMVTMPASYNIPFQSFWKTLFELFPNAFPILRYLLRFNQ